MLRRGDALLGTAMGDHLDINDAPGLPANFVDVKSADASEISDI